MIRSATLLLGGAAMIFASVRMKEQKLDDIAVVQIPRMVKRETFKGSRTDQPGRIAFTFETTYFWASMGSGPAYKHQLHIAYMAPDATAEQWAESPRNFDALYGRSREVGTRALGTGTLRIREASYVQNALDEPAWTFAYQDRARRLAITWHAVKDEIDLDDAIDAIDRMAKSFRVVREPAELFAEMRDRPRKEGEERGRRVEVARAMLAREGFGALAPGKPVLRNGMWVEWTNDPEPRYQILVPLGRVRTSPDADAGERPRPAWVRGPDGSAVEFAGTVGWREFIDGEWTASNGGNDYLPFDGISAAMAAEQKDPGFVYFYYSGSVRVEQQSDDERLASLKWFLDGVPEVRRLWREGRLVRGGSPEDE